MKEEWKQVVHSTWLKIVLVAIMVIPMIYSGVFLGSMWDPYGKADAIPVAVVNKDEAVTYNKKTLHVGKELVSNLLDSNSMGFTISNEREAKKGLTDGKYYMIITIPEDFSQHATTLLDQNPKKMELRYTTNPGTNYIASKMDDSAMQKIKEEVSSSITKTYADTLFSQVQTLSGGLKDADKGSATLYNGVKVAKDGSQTLQDTLAILANSTLTFKDGTSEFQVGLKTYTKGVKDVNQGTLQLQDGMQTLSNKSAALPDGITKLKDGSTSLHQGIVSYSDGVASLQKGSHQLVKNNTALQNGITTIGQGSASLYQGSSHLLSGLQQMSNSLGLSIENNTTKITQLQTGNTTAIQQMKDMKQQAAVLKTTFQAIQKQQLDTLIKLDTIKTNDPTSIQVIQELKDMNQTDYTSIIAVLDQLATQSDTMTTLLSGDQQMIEGLTNGLQQIKTSLDAKNEQGIIIGVQSIKNGLHQLDVGLNDTDGLVNSVYKYSDGVTILDNGTSLLNNTSSSLINGSDQLKNGADLLNRDVPSLTKGISQVSNGVTVLHDGTKKLTANSPVLLAGISSLDDGARQLQDGSHKLANGSVDLNSGLKKLQDGSSVLNEALHDGALKSSLQTTQKTSDMMANPVDMTHEELSTVQNNGHAMAPYMMSVGLYVACMAFTLMYPLLKNTSKTKNGFRLWLHKASVMYTLSTTMGIGMIIALMFVNGLQPYSITQTLLMAVLVGAAFMSLIVFLNLALGKIGSFVTLVFMVFQLGGAAGTYPIETSSSFYQLLHPYMPFSYSVEAFRNTLSLGGDITGPCIVFITMIVIFSGLSILFYQWKVRISEEQFEKTLLAKFQ